MYFSQLSFFTVTKRLWLYLPAILTGRIKNFTRIDQFQSKNVVELKSLTSDLTNWTSFLRASVGDVSAYPMLQGPSTAPPEGWPAFRHYPLIWRNAHQQARCYYFPWTAWIHLPDVGISPMCLGVWNWCGITYQPEYRANVRMLRLSPPMPGEFRKTALLTRRTQCWLNSSRWDSSRRQGINVGSRRGAGSAGPNSTAASPRIIDGAPLCISQHTCWFKL